MGEDRECKVTVSSEAEEIDRGLRRGKTVLKRQRLAGSPGRTFFCSGNALVGL